MAASNAVSVLKLCLSSSSLVSLRQKLPGLIDGHTHRLLDIIVPREAEIERVPGSLLGGEACDCAAQDGDGTLGEGENGLGRGVA